LLETERRAALRQHEDEVAAEAQRLDDVAKEQRLRQVESMEQAYQTQLQASHASCLIASLQISLHKSGRTEKQLQFNNWHTHTHVCQIKISVTMLCTAPAGIVLHRLVMNVGSIEARGLCNFMAEVTVNRNQLCKFCSTPLTTCKMPAAH